MSAGDGPALGTGMDLLEPSGGPITGVVVFSYIGFSCFSFNFLIPRNRGSCSERQAEEEMGLRMLMTSPRGAAEALQ